MDIQELRQKYPEYNDMTNDQFAQGFHKKFYSDMDFDTFSKKIGYTQNSKSQQQVVQQNSPIVDMIPGIGKATPAEADPTLLEKAYGTGEAALSQGANLIGSMVGWPAAVGQAGINAALNAITGSEYPTSPPELFEDYMSGMYQPKTTSGKQQNAVVNENVTRHLIAAMPLMHEAAVADSAKSMRKANDAMVTKAKIDAGYKTQRQLDLEKIRSQTEATPETTKPTAQEFPLKSREQLMQEDLQARLQQEGYSKSLEQPQGEAPLPFVPELYKEEAPTLPKGKKEKIAEHEPVPTEAERIVAEREQQLSQPIPFERTPIDPSIVDFVPQESGLPFSVENKLSTPVDVNTLAKPVQQGLRDIADLTKEVSDLKEQLSSKTEIGPEQQMAISERLYDLENAVTRTAANSEEATKIGRDIAQLRVKLGGETKVPLQVEQSKSLLNNFYTPRQQVPVKTAKGQTRAGKSQRGSIGFFGKGSFEDFVKETRAEIPDVTQQELQQLWKLEQDRGELAKTEQVRTKVYGDPTKQRTAQDKVPFTDLNPDKVFDDLVKATDSARDENWFEKNLMSSGYMRAVASENPAVGQAIRYLKSVVDKNRNRAENALFRPGNKDAGIESGFIHDLSRNEKFFNVSEMADMFKQWFESKNNPEYKLNLNERQQKVYDKINAILNKMLDEVNQYRPEDKKIQKLPNYIPSVHTGKFYLEVSTKKADGSHSKPILWGMDNSRSAEGIRSYLQNEGYEVSKVKTREPVQNGFGDTAENRAANYQYMLDILTDSDPTVVALGNKLIAEQQSMATTTAGQHQHFKQYKGFKGEMGNNPFKSDKQNYYDAKKMLINFVESHYSWLSAQEGAAFGKRLTDAGSKIGENNRSIINRYISDSVIGKRLSNGVEHVAHSIIEGISGASPHQQKAAAGFIGNTMTAMLTSMGSPVHALQNVVQPLTIIIPKMLQEGLHPVDMTTLLTKGLAEYATVFLGKQIGEVTKLFGTDVYINPKFLQDKMTYAERAGIVSPTIVDSTPVFNNKYANRAHQFGIQGFLSKPSEQAARFTVFSSMTDFYMKRGLTKTEAFNKAREVTENYMVDYGPDAKANLWKDSGFVGSLAGRLQQFATNQMSQTYTYGKNAYKGGMNDKMAFVSYLGVLIALGGIAGLPGYDAFEALINSLKSKDGKQFSLRNEIRSSVGDAAIGGAWEIAGLGAAPSFATRSVNTDGVVPLPAMIGVPAFSKIPEIARTVGRRVTSDHKWEEETQAEKGRELISAAPVSLRGLVENKYLTENVGGKTHNISPMSGKILHTQTGPETSFGNIRSSERAKSSDLSNQAYTEDARFKKQRKELQSELDGQIRDIYQYGHGNAQKQLRFLKDYRKFVVDYAGNPEELSKVLNDIRPYVTDEYLAKMVAVGQKSNVTLEDARQLLFAKKYHDLKTGTK